MRKLLLVAVVLFKIGFSIELEQVGTIRLFAQPRYKNPKKTNNYISASAGLFNIFKTGEIVRFLEEYVSGDYISEIGFYDKHLSLHKIIKSSTFSKEGFLDWIKVIKKIDENRILAIDSKGVMHIYDKHGNLMMTKYIDSWGILFYGGSLIDDSLLVVSGVVNKGDSVFGGIIYNLNTSKVLTVFQPMDSSLLKLIKEHENLHIGTDGYFTHINTPDNKIMGWYGGLPYIYIYNPDGSLSYVIKDTPEDYVSILNSPLLNDVEARDLKKWKSSFSYTGSIFFYGKDTFFVVRKHGWDELELDFYSYFDKKYIGSCLVKHYVLGADDRYIYMSLGREIGKKGDVKTIGLYVVKEEVNTQKLSKDKVIKPDRFSIISSLLPEKKLTIPIEDFKIQTIDGTEKTLADILPKKYAFVYFTYPQSCLAYSVNRAADTMIKLYRKRGIDIDYYVLEVAPSKEGLAFYLATMDKHKGTDEIDSVIGITKVCKKAPSYETLLFYSPLTGKLKGSRINVNAKKPFGYIIKVVEKELGEIEEE